MVRSECVHYFIREAVTIEQAERNWREGNKKQLPFIKYEIKAEPFPRSYIGSEPMPKHAPIIPDVKLGTGIKERDEYLEDTVDWFVRVLMGCYKKYSNKTDATNVKELRDYVEEAVKEAEEEDWEEFEEYVDSHDESYQEHPEDFRDDECVECAFEEFSFL